MATPEPILNQVKSKQMNENDAKQAQPVEASIPPHVDFGTAIQALKSGQRATRVGWNGKGMFIFMRPDDDIPVAVVVERVVSLPLSVKEYFKSEDLKRDPSEQGLTKIKFTAYLCMKAADGSIVNGWLASQTDILAEDWMIID